MCRMLLLLSLILSSDFLFGSSAFAQEGDRVRNGGFVIRCESSQDNLPRLMVLDHYESLKKYSKKVSVTEGSPWRLILTSYFERIRSFNPTRYELYSQWLRNFDKESKFLENQHLQVPPDYDFGVIPAAGCKLEVGVMQVHPKLGETVRYYIDGLLWNELSEMGKAILIFHELVYREAMLPENGQKNSLLSRFYVGQVIADDFANLKLADYLKIVMGAGLQSADAHGVRIALYATKEDGSRVGLPLFFYDPNTVQMAVPAAFFSFAYSVGNAKDSAIVLCNASALLSDKHRVLFYPNGLIRRVTISASPMDCPLIPINFIGKGVYVGGSMKASEVNLSVQGQVTELGQWQTIGIPSAGLVYYSDELRISATYMGEGSHFQVRFYPSGTVKSIFVGLNEDNLRSGFYRKSPSEGWSSFFSMSKNFISFSEDGTIQGFDFKYLDDSVRE